MNVLPSIFIIVGLLATLAGIYLLVGLPVVLIVGGVAMLSCGVAADLRWG